jgi:hypothetical protein
MGFNSAFKGLTNQTSYGRKPYTKIKPVLFTRLNDSLNHYDKQHRWYSD